MRALLSKVMTGSMIAGAALVVAACGSNDNAANNMTDMNAADTMMDGTTNDVTAVDAGTGMDNNMAMDTNMTMDANMTGNMTDMNATTTDTNMTNGM